MQDRYAGQELVPLNHTTKIRLYDSELEAGADPELLMTEELRQAVYKSVRPLKYNPVPLSTENRELLYRMASIPFNEQARLLLTEVLGVKQEALPIARGNAGPGFSAVTPGPYIK